MSQGTERADHAPKRVVITGVGAVSPAGIGAETLWEKLLAKEVCVGPITRFDVGDYDYTLAAQVPDFDPTEYGLSKKEARRFARFVQYAIIASDEALEQSGIVLEDEDLTRFGCTFGSGIGGIEEFERGCNTLSEKGMKRLNPLFIPTMVSNMAAGNLSIRYGLRGSCTNVVTACSTGTQCIGEAYRSIRHGYIDAALVGGTEEAITPVCLAGFGNLGALTKATDPAQASRPFDVRRDGFVPAEGAGALIIESLDHALARGANILAELTGYGSTGDAYHMTAPEPSGEGAVRAMQQALDEAGFEPSDLGHLNAHGTSTPINDRTESIALHTLCGDAASDIPVTSIKGSIGHSLGAAGALEAIITTFSVMRDTVPPTTGFAEADPECAVRVVSEPLTNYPQKVALSNSLGFGGHNASLAFSPYGG